MKVFNIILGVLAAAVIIPIAIVVTVVRFALSVVVGIITMPFMLFA